METVQCSWYIKHKTSTTATAAASWTEIDLMLAKQGTQNREKETTSKSNPETPSSSEILRAPRC